MKKLLISVVFVLIVNSISFIETMDTNNFELRAKNDYKVFVDTELFYKSHKSSPEKMDELTGDLAALKKELSEINTEAFQKMAKLTKQYAGLFAWYEDRKMMRIKLEIKLVKKPENN